MLNSGLLGRSHNLAQVLKYICEKHFEGGADQITEQSIAVEALGRRPDFDPQADTIVRVTTHHLRKLLRDFYEGEGAVRPVHVLIPPGQYAPSFIYRATASREEPPATQEEKPDSPAAPELPTVVAAPGSANRWMSWGIGSIAVVAILCIGALAVRFWLKPRVVHTRAAAHRWVLQDPAPMTGSTAVRALLGDGRKPYVDHSGFKWSPGKYCSQGTTVAETGQEVAGTEDPAIFLGGVRGIAHCAFSVKPGIYEVHLLFAELSPMEEARHYAVFTVNGGDANTFDVVDDAGGDGIATTKVIRGVRPENDGAIHVDFISDASLLKAVEILQTPTEAMLPIRIVAGPGRYIDNRGHVWLSDRYFIGGRRGRNPSKADGVGVYGSHRIGHFRYVLPVIPRERYQVRLYFQEPWFGKQNGGTGGAHSRVFDVWCNGSVLLRDFDMLNETGPGPIVKTFDNIQATAQGKIEISFIPVVNYPLVDAIEVLPETEQ